MKTNDVQIEIEKKGRKRRKKLKVKSTSATQESRKKRARKGNGIRKLQARGGGIAPRRNNIITESATSVWYQVISTTRYLVLRIKLQIAVLQLYLLG